MHTAWRIADGSERHRPLAALRSAVMSCHQAAIKTSAPSAGRGLTGPGMLPAILSTCRHRLSSDCLRALWERAPLVSRNNGGDAGRCAMHTAFRHLCTAAGAQCVCAKAVILEPHYAFCRRGGSGIGHQDDAPPQRCHELRAARRVHLLLIACCVTRTRSGRRLLDAPLLQC